MRDGGASAQKLEVVKLGTAAAADTASQHWRDLCEAIDREGKGIGGFGSVTVEIAFHGGLPKSMKVLKREPVYRFGDTRPPLTGDSPLGPRPDSRERRT